MDIAWQAGGVCGRRAGDHVLDVPFSGRTVRLVGLRKSGVETSSPEEGVLVVGSIWPRRVDIRLRAVPVEMFVDGPCVEWRGDVVKAEAVGRRLARGTDFEAATGTVVVFRDGPAYGHLYKQALDTIWGAANEDKAAMLATILCEEAARVVVQSLAWRFLCPDLGGEGGIQECLRADAVGDAILRTRIAPCWRCASEEGGACSIAVNGGAKL